MSKNHSKRMTMEELADFRKKLENISVSGPRLTGGASDDDAAKGLRHHEDFSESAAAKKNFDQKVYMFPESFNQLRKELHDNWPRLWALVGYRMAYRPEEFVEYMNSATDLALVLDSGRVEWICTQYLNALRAKRGLSH